MNSNYENGKIYKIFGNTTDMVYIGSTYKTLQQRLKQHEANYKSFKAGKYWFITSFKILENNNYKIELVENYPCNSKQELELEEGKIIKQYRTDKLNIVNRHIAGQSQKEYYKDYKNTINEKANKKNTCSCGGNFTYAHKSQHEKTKKHQDYINNSKIINIETININITVNNLDDLKQLELDF